MSESDVLVLVDLLDREVGTAGKMEAHRNGLLHRAFSVYVVDGDRMLLQRRHAGKYHSGSLWTNACCSHPHAGEELTDAVERRMQEELGFSCPVEHVDGFVYRSVYENGLTEYEYDHVFLGEYAGPVEPDPEEVDELAWVDIDELAADVAARPERYTTWFVIGFPRVCARLKGVS
jgi:isopentenyl-diphosphate delta-isomerase